MEIDTYRYLISALIQVFGALVAVDVVFLVIKYQDSRNRLDKIAFELGRMIAMIEKYGKRESKSDYYKYDSDAMEFQVLDSTKQEQKARDTEKKLLNTIERIQKTASDSFLMTECTDTLKLFQSQHNLYLSIINPMNQLPNLVCKLMGLPALTMIVLSSVLLIADMLPGCWLFTVSCCSIVASTLSVTMLIYWAKKSFEE